MPREAMEHAAAENMGSVSQTETRRPMTSREKVDQAIAAARDAQPQTEQEAMLAQMLQVAGPMVGPMIPQDPVELDDQILRLAKWLVSMRSDDAELEAAVFIKRCETGEVVEGAELVQAREDAPTP
jgi:hypothetical protein